MHARLQIWSVCVHQSSRYRTYSTTSHGHKRTLLDPKQRALAVPQPKANKRIGKAFNLKEEEEQEQSREHGAFLLQHWCYRSYTKRFGREIRNYLYFCRVLGGGAHLAKIKCRGCSSCTLLTWTLLTMMPTQCWMVPSQPRNLLLLNSGIILHQREKGTVPACLPEIMFCLLEYVVKISERAQDPLFDKTWPYFNYITFTQ